MNSLTINAPIPFEKELEHLKNYLYIESLRFGDKLKICYDLKVTSFLCPPLTLQPLVENAIKHGILERTNGGTVIVSTFETETDYILKIIDNGVGFDTSKPRDEGHIGLANTENRLKAMSDGVLAVESSDLGTTVTVTIPKGELK